MTRARGLLLLTLSVALGFLLVGCGSGGAPVESSDQSSGTETVRTERADRQSTVALQQQQTEQSQPTELSQPTEPSQQEAATSTAQSQQSTDSDSEPDAQSAEVETEEVSSDEVASNGVIDFGHREGLSFARNVVGDPDAPVLIVEYSDFQ